MDAIQTQMLTLRIPRDLAQRLNAKAPAGERSAFVARAIARAIDGESDDFTAGYRAGRREGVKHRIEQELTTMRCYDEALQLVRNGMDIVPALRQAFKEAENQT